MTDPAHQPGWYPDPWGRATQRWHDGTRWTEHVDGNAPAGAAVPPLVPAAQPHTSGLAIASLVTAVLGVALVGLILGILALRSIRASAGTVTGRGLAIAGIVISSVWMVLVTVAILLALAVPTFLVQRDAAVSGQAQANLKQVVNAVEACAAGNVDGTYRGCGSAGVAELEPAFATLLDACGQPGGVCLELDAGDAPTGYEVTAMTKGPETATFSLKSNADGTLSKTCAPAGVSGCTTGLWS